MDIDTITDNFNNVAIEFIGQLKIVCPHSIIANNIDAIEMLINKQTTKNKIIDQFTFYVLKYKDKIDDHNEDFFLKETFEEESDGNSSIIMIINEVKGAWTGLCDDDKARVFDYLRVMCFYSQEYLLKTE